MTPPLLRDILRAVFRTEPLPAWARELADRCEAVR